MAKTIILQKTILYIFTFLYIFNPGNFLNFNLVYVLGFLSLFYLLLNKKYAIMMLSNKSIFILFFICLLFFFYLIFFYFFGNTDAILRGYSFLVVWLSIFSSLAIVGMFKSLYVATIDKFLNFIINVTCIQIFFVILSIILPSFRDWVLSTARQTDILMISNDAGSGLRSFGLSSGFTSTFPMFMGICAIFSLHMFISKKDVYEKIKYLIISLLLIFSIILNARTGLIPVILFLLILPISIFMKKDFKNIILLCSFVVILFFLPNINFYNNDYLFRLMQALEEFDSLSTGKKTGTFEALSNMWFFPDNTVSILFGEGVKIVGAFPRGSDIGFIQDVFMFGLIPTVFLSLCLVYVFSPLFRKIKSYYGVLFFQVFIVSLLFFYMKGVTFYANEISNLIILMLCFVVFENYLRDKHQS